MQKRCPRCQQFFEKVTKTSVYCPPCGTQRSHEWRAAHPTVFEADRVRMKAWRAEHPEEKAAQNRAYREAQKTNDFEGYRAHRRQKKQERKHRARDAPAEKIDIALLYKRDRGRCHICGKRVPEREVTLDHIVPLSMRGGYTVANLRIAHARCNSSRGAARLPGQAGLF